MCATFGASPAAVGSIPALTQLGYAVGMLLLVPLGDRFERRGLTTLSLAATAVALWAAAAAPTLLALALASCCLGVVTVAPQLCLRASREQNAAADSFLESGCAVLRRAFDFEGLLLQPITPGAAPCGATIVWWEHLPIPQHYT